MSDAPKVDPGKWIRVGSIDCLVARLDANAESPTVDVLCNPDRPTIYQVVWDGRAWSFAHPMRGTYAEHSPEIGVYAEAMKRGPQGKTG